MWIATVAALRLFVTSIPDRIRVYHMYPTVYERRRGTYKGLLFNQELFLCSSVVKDRRAGVFGRSDVRHLRVRHESRERGGDKSSKALLL